MELKEIIKNKDVFIFDLDGTLIDSVGVWNLIDQKLIENLTALKIALNDINYERDRVIGMSKSSDPYYEYVCYLKDKYKINYDIESIVQYRKVITDDYLYNFIKLKPYSKILIDLLYDTGKTIVLATTTNRRCLNIYKYNNPFTSVLKFDEKFKLQLTMEDVKFYKPDPEVHIRILEQLSIEPERVVIIEDSLSGVMAGKMASIDVIAVMESSSLEKAEEIKRLSTYYAESLEEIYENYRKIVKNRPKMLKNTKKSN